MADTESPILTTPLDIAMTYGDTQSITWTIHDSLVDPLNTPVYNIYKDGVLITGPLAFANNEVITVDLSAVAAGSYVYQLSANDGVNAAVTDNVTVTIHAVNVGLADAIYALLDLNWDATLIAKPTLRRNQYNLEYPPIRTCIINAKMEGDLKSNCADNSNDIRGIPFQIAYSEASMNLAIQSMKAIKKVLHRNFPTAGHYHINTFLFNESEKICQVKLTGYQSRLIEDDDF